MRYLAPAGVVAGLLTLAVNASAAETACGSVTVVATFSSRTTLRVSADLLQFDVTSSESPATAAVEFLAAARTQAGAQVVLSIEPVRASGGPLLFDPSLSFTGEGEGTTFGSLDVAGPAIAGRWTGSGVRRGRLVFALRSATTGTFSVPIRFVLSAP